MSTCTSVTTYKGRGSVAIALRASDGSLGPWQDVAEARRLEITTTQDFEDEYSRCDRNSGQIIHSLNQTDYEVALDTFDFSKEQLAIAYYGTSTSIGAGSAAAESLDFTAVGQSIPLENPFGVSALVIGALIEDTDYSVDYEHGIVTSLTITSTETAAYDFIQYDVVEAAVNGVQEYAIRFDGININDNMPYQVYLHRIALNMAASLSLITDTTAVLEMTGKLLSDATKGAGESKFFQAKIGNIAV